MTADVTPTNVRTDFNMVLNNGTTYRFKYYNQEYNTGSYDDFNVITQSGTDFYTNGLMFNLDKLEGSDEAIALQQGFITINDSKIFLSYDVVTSGLFTLAQSGTSMGDEYTVVPNGNNINIVSIGGQPAFKKVFIRRITTGSLF